MFDDLVSREVMDFARREARKMLVGKTGFGPSCTQEDINTLMVSLAKQGQARRPPQGRRPADFRARGRGDRGVRGGQDRRRCGARHHVGAGRSVAARYCADGSQEGTTAAIRHRACENTAASRQTSTGRASRIQRRPLRCSCRRGRLPRWPKRRSPKVSTRDTPALAISRATRPDQAVVSAPIGELAEQLAQAGLPGPVLVMIGKTVSSASGAVSRRSTGNGIAAQ